MFPEVLSVVLLVLLLANLVIFALRRPIESSETDDGGDNERSRERRRAARERARALLWSHLNDAQRQEFDTAGSFVVAAPSGRRYRITPATTFNIEDDNGTDYCVQFRTDRQCRSVPVEDLMLAQKLLLECDEPEFLRIANKRSGMTAWSC